VKEVADGRLIIHRHVQIATGDADVGMAGSVPDLGQ
jgi:hypothetical protein